MNIVQTTICLGLEQQKRNPDMLRVVPYDFKTKKTGKHAVEKLAFEIRYVPDWYKTQKMCDNILENDGTLKLVPKCYKNQNIYHQTFDNYAQILWFVPDCYKTQVMCNKSVNTYPSTIWLVLEYYKAQKMYDKAVNTSFFVFN